MRTKYSGVRSPERALADETWISRRSPDGDGVNYNDLTVHPQMALTQVSEIFEGSLEVKLPTIWTDEKQSREEAERRERLEERRVEEKE